MREICRRSILVALVATFIPVGREYSAFAADNGTDVYDAVNVVIKWFGDLNTTFGHLASVEEGQQLARLTRPLADGLYKMELDSRSLLRLISNDPPTPAQREALRRLNSSLRGQLIELDSQLRNLGSQLRIGGAGRVEYSINLGLQNRDRAINLLSAVLRVHNPEAWDPQRIRTYLENGIITIGRAQMEVARFYAKVHGGSH